MLLEEGEFIREKATQKVKWIEKINRYDNTIEIGSMDNVVIYEKATFNKSYEIMSRKEFYERFEDL